MQGLPFLSSLPGTGPCCGSGPLRGKGRCPAPARPAHRCGGRHRSHSPAWHAARRCNPDAAGCSRRRVPPRHSPPECGPARGCADGPECQRRSACSPLRCAHRLRHRGGTRHKNGLAVRAVGHTAASLEAARCAGSGSGSSVRAWVIVSFGSGNAPGHGCGSAGAVSAGWQNTCWAARPWRA